MGAFWDAVRVALFAALTAAVWCFCVKGLVHWVAKLTDDEPSYVCVGVPGAVLVMDVLLAVWTVAAM